MNIEISQIDQALATNGNAQGGFTVASTTGIYPGAFGQLYDTAGNNMAVQVVSVPDSTHVTVRQSAQAFGGVGAGGPQAASTPGAPAQTLTQNLPPNYGYSNVSAFLTANAARFCQNAGIVRVEPSNVAVPLV